MEFTTHTLRRSGQRAAPYRSIAGLCLAVALILLFTEQRADAYIDPGSGSLIYQTALALLLGFGFMFRRIASSVTRLFKRRPDSDSDAPEAPGPDRR
jgi:hypothetical protein